MQHFSLFLSLALISIPHAEVELVDSTPKYPDNQIRSIKAHRHPNNPLITFRTSETLLENINGPSVIRVPSWVDKPLGAYYMYFAHHSGRFIRLAYADSLAGPWTVHEPGTLKLTDATSFRGHIASPDVHIDQKRRQLRMYFHGPTKEKRGQWSGLALSEDGLHFEASEDLLGKFYFRVWQWQETWYALAKDWNSGWGELYRSKDGLTDFNSRGNFLSNVRHCAVLVRGHHLLVFYSRKGDSPERIVVSTVDMRPDWRKWEPSEAIEVLKPEADYEGIEYPIEPSEYGSAIKVNQLRDPCVYEEDERVYLFYTIAGEMGIAMAELEIEMK